MNPNSVDVGAHPQGDSALPRRSGIDVLFHLISFEWARVSLGSSSEVIPPFLFTTTYERRLTRNCQLLSVNICNSSTRPCRRPIPIMKRCTVNVTPSLLNRLETWECNIVDNSIKMICASLFHCSIRGFRDMLEGTAVSTTHSALFVVQNTCNVGIEYRGFHPVPPIPISVLKGRNNHISYQEFLANMLPTF